MAIQEFSSGMKNEIYAEFKWLLQVRCSKSIIYGYYDPMLFCQSGDGFDIDSLNSGIGRCFDIDLLDLVPEYAFFNLTDLTHVHDDRLNAVWFKDFMH